MTKLAALAAAATIGLLAACQQASPPEAVLDRELAVEATEWSADASCAAARAHAGEIADLERQLHGLGPGPGHTAADHELEARRVALELRLSALHSAPEVAGRPEEDERCLAKRYGRWSRLLKPWPDASTLDPAIVAEKVHWPSSSPFTPEAIGAGPQRDPPTTAVGYLYRPRGARPPHSVPAVMLLHGSGGILPSREETYGRQLASMGIATLVVGYFAARPWHGEGSVEHVLNVTETMALADAYSGLRFLAGLPEIDPRRTVLAGFSYGGMITLFGLQAQIADKLAPPGLRFAGHAAFYGPCITRFVDRRTTGAPALMLIGGGDAIVDPRRCAEIAGDLRTGGSHVHMILYPAAYHQWDSGETFRQIGKVIAGCSIGVEPDGRIFDRLSGIQMGDKLSREVILALCTVGASPFSAGNDEAVRARSNRDFGRFLADAFSRAPARTTQGPAAALP